MFSCKCNRRVGKLFSLKAQDHFPHNVRCERRVLSKRPLYPLPPWLRSDVCHVHVSLSKSNCSPFLASNVGELTCEFEVPHGCKSDLGRPFRKRSSAHAGTD